jgi:23S rRNA pseudouridine2605 synthase
VFIPRRLDKYLGESTSMTLVEVAEAWRAGRVSVVPGSGASGVSRPALDLLVFEDDVVCLDGVVLAPRQRHQHAMLNKPRQVTCTARDPNGKADLSRWLDQMPAGVFPVGRLDRPTTGLMLFTSDGDLSNAVLRPEHHTRKVYWLWLNEVVADDDPRLRSLTRGLQVGGHTVRASAVAVKHRTADFTELLVTLEQGRNRQVRRMCRALGLRLVHLHRTAVGPLELGHLELAAWRHLRAEEVESLWDSVGGRAWVKQRKLAALRHRAARARAAHAPHHRLEGWLSRAAAVSIAPRLDP